MTETKKTILCVDDEPAIVEFLALMFERDGYLVDTAEGGWPAFEQVQAKHYDFVLSDVRMVKGDGIEFLENVQELAVRPPVGLLSAFTDVSTSDIYERGAVAFLQKPIVWPTVLDTVRRVTTPRAQRWSGNSVSGPALTGHWPSWADALKSGELAFGTGGLFFAGKNLQIAVDTPVTFEFTFGKGAPGKLAGSATVRWARTATRHGFIPGLGLEILSLDTPSLAFLLPEIERTAPKPSVPIGYSKGRS